MARAGPKKAIEAGVHWMVNFTITCHNHRRSCPSHPVDERQLDPTTSFPCHAISSLNSKFTRVDVKKRRRSVKHAQSDDVRDWKWSCLGIGKGYPRASPDLPIEAHPSKRCLEQHARQGERYEVKHLRKTSSNPQLGPGAMGCHKYTIMNNVFTESEVASSLPLCNSTLKPFDKQETILF